MPSALSGVPARQAGGQAGRRGLVSGSARVLAVAPPGGVGPLPLARAPHGRHFDQKGALGEGLPVQKHLRQRGGRAGAAAAA